MKQLEKNQLKDVVGGKEAPRLLDLWERSGGNAGAFINQYGMDMVNSFADQAEIDGLIDKDVIGLLFAYLEQNDLS